MDYNPINYRYIPLLLHIQMFTDIKMVPCAYDLSMILPTRPPLDTLDKLWKNVEAGAQRQPLSHG